MRTLHPSIPPARRLALIGAATAALALLPALPAAAHDQLVSATPAADSVVRTDPGTVALTFDAALLELGGGRNGIVVTDSAGRHYETACATVSGDDMTAPVRLGGAGTYSVAWRGVSSDGHGVEDVYRFDYRPAAGASAAPGSASGPACGGTTTAAGERSGAASALPGGALAAGAIGGAVLLAAVAAVLVVVVRLRRSQDGEAGR